MPKLNVSSVKISDYFFSKNKSSDFFTRHKRIDFELPPFKYDKWGYGDYFDKTIYIATKDDFSLEWLKRNGEFPHNSPIWGIIGEQKHVGRTWT